jgi:CHAT domain
MNNRRYDGAKAFLMFNNDEPTKPFAQDDDVTPVDATDIAALLLDYDIDCAVLSACKSAKADAKVGANLSWSFLDAGMSSVLAMSYNMPDSMSKIFCGRFYYELFIGREEFASAATKARYELRKNPLRWSYNAKDWVPLQDWFIPVVYSDGKPWKIHSREGMQSSLQPILLLLIPWLCLILKAKYAPKSTYNKILQPIQSILNSFDPQINQYFLATALNCIFMAYYFNFPLAQWRQWRFNKCLKTIDQDRKNILRIEMDLKRSRKIFLRTLNDMDNSAQQLLDSLTDIWRRTHLVEHRVLVDAKWFIRHFEADNLLATISGIAWIKSFAHILMMLKVHSSPGMKHLSSSTGENRAGTVVVIYNVNSLYPEDLKFENYHLLARQRFIAWLGKHFTISDQAGADGLKAIPWYLVIVGEGHPAWALATGEALDSNSITEYTNPQDFPHNPERSWPPRSWL